MKQPFISIHILNYNGKKFLKGCIDSLLKQNYSNYEIVLIDNASIDDSVPFIEKLYKKEIKNGGVRILPFEKNYGVAGGYNRSYKQTKADYILLLNNDVIIPKTSFLKQLLNTSKKEKAPLTAAWAYPFNVTKSEKKKIDKILNPTLTILGFGMANILKENTSIIAGVCCLLVNKSVIKSPLFPEEYFCYGEDVFLGWKSFLENKKSIFDKNAIFLHHGSGTAGKRSYLARYHSEKNRIANLLIFFEKKTLIKLFPLFLFESFVKSIYLVNSPKLFRALFRALFWNIKNYSVIKRYRKEIQGTRKVRDKELISFMSDKLFPEYISGASEKFNRVLRFFNNLSKIYLQAVNLRTYKSQ